MRLFTRQLQLKNGKKAWGRIPPTTPYAMSCRRLTFLRCGFLIVWHWLNISFICLPLCPSQAQFVLCIVHTIRAMLAKDCSFPKFISALLLLNASIFFVLFMNFYIQNYKKRRVQEQSIADAAAKANAGGRVAPVAIEAKKVQWGGKEGRSGRSLPIRTQKTILN